MAHKKAQAPTTRNGRDSHSSVFGRPSYGGETVTAGSILIRQRHLGDPRPNVGRGSDTTL